MSEVLKLKSIYELLCNEEGKPESFREVIDGRSSKLKNY